MTDPEFKYDVFISYASEERAWVEKNIYAPLCRCRTRDRRRPRIFFDISRETGIKTGENWQSALANAIGQSRRMVPIYSPTYFKKPKCNWELGIGWDRDSDARDRFLSPVAKEAVAPPAFVTLVHFVTFGQPDWFGRLCESLDLTPCGEVLNLEFLTQPRDLLVNHTLPPILVAVRDSAAGGLELQEEEVSVATEKGTLQGTLRARTVKGIATFNDLSVCTVEPRTRLVAGIEGVKPVLSEPFSVQPPSPDMVVKDRPAERTPRIPVVGEAVFFADGRAIAVISPDAVSVYDVTAKALTEKPLALSAPLRLVQRAGALVVLADWLGNVYLMSQTGAAARHSLGPASIPWAVPGGVAVVGDNVWVGFWSGEVHRLSLNGTHAVELCHPAGVQAIAAVGGRLFIADFEGNLAVYRDGTLTNSERLEPAIRMLRVVDSRLLALGDERMYLIYPGPPVKILDDSVPLDDVADVLDESARMVLIDSQGKGFRFDADLNLVTSFHTVAGAVPVSADDVGEYCVFRSSDSSRTLLWAQRDILQGRIVYTHLGGTLAVSPQADLFALGDEDGIRLLDRAALEKRVGKEAPSG